MLLIEEKKEEKNTTRERESEGRGVEKQNVINNENSYFFGSKEKLVRAFCACEIN
jgi:hypothetical protein